MGSGMPMVSARLSLFWTSILKNGGGGGGGGVIMRC
jgi:hypothetical protein